VCAAIQNLQVASQHVQLERTGRVPGAAQLSWDGRVPFLESFQQLRLVESKEHVVATPRDEKPSAPKLEIKLLGRFEVLRDGEPILEEAWGRRKTKSLLKVLLTDQGAVFAVDQIIEAIFPDADPERAARNVQARISELRRVLEPGLERGAKSQFIRHIGEGYALTVGPDLWIDSAAFTDQLATARTLADASEWTPAVEAFEDALTLYRGDFLAEDRYTEWAESPRRRLREQYLEALSQLAECFAALGRLRQAISCCQRVLGAEPYRESVIRQLMEHQDAAGYRAQALDAFREGVRALDEHLGVEPSIETHALYTRIRDRVTSAEDLDPRRVAVLPFANYSPDPEDSYLADGMTEELTGHLSRIRDLRVVARTSVMRFKGSTKPVPQIARELRAGTMLEGSVRKDGESIRVSAQLIKAGTEEHLWANEYGGKAGDLLAFQQDVAHRVAEALEVVLFSDEVSRPARLVSDTSEAYSIYLRGTVFGARATAEGQHKALACYQQAIELDPQLAVAHAGIGRYYTVMHGWEDAAGNEIRPAEAYAKARLALLRALELDPDLADAHAALGLLQAIRECRFDAAEASYRRAIRLDPSNLKSHGWYSVLLLHMNRIDEALNEARCAMDVDPISQLSYIWTAGALKAARRLEEAEELLDQAIDMHPSVPMENDKAKIRWLLWDWEGGLAAAEEYCRKMDLPGGEAWFRGRCALYLGRIADSLSEFEAVEGGSVGERRNGVEYGLALYHAREYAQVISLMDGLLAADSFGIGYAGKSWFRLLKGLALERMGKDGEAIAELREARQGLPEWKYGTYSRGPILAEAAEALIKRRLGEAWAARQAMDRLAKRSQENEVASALAVLHFHTGEVDAGFEWLNTALDHRDDFILTIKTHPWFDPVRDDPRFAGVLRQMNLTE